MADVSWEAFIVARKECEELSDAIKGVHVKFGVAAKRWMISCFMASPNTQSTNGNRQECHVCRPKSR